MAYRPTTSRQPPTRPPTRFCQALVALRSQHVSRALPRVLRAIQHVRGACIDQCDAVIELRVDKWHLVDDLLERMKVMWTWPSDAKHRDVANRLGGDRTASLSLPIAISYSLSVPQVHHLFRDCGLWSIVTYLDVQSSEDSVDVSRSIFRTRPGKITAPVRSLDCEKLSSAHS